MTECSCGAAEQGSNRHDIRCALIPQEIAEYWQNAMTEAFKLELDKRIYGTAFIKDGKRIDPVEMGYPAQPR